LGSDTIRSIILSTPLLPEHWPPRQGLALLQFWNHSRAVALACSTLSEYLAPQLVEEAYLSGLFHDLGKLFIELWSPMGKEKIYSIRPETELDILELERDQLDTDHGSLASLSFSRWMMPSVYTQSAARHHAGYASIPAQGQMIIIRLVYLANKIAVSAGYGCSSTSASSVIGEWDFSQVEMDLKKGRDILQRCKDSFDSEPNFPLTAHYDHKMLETLQRTNLALGAINLSSAARQMESGTVSKSGLSNFFTLGEDLAQCREISEALKLAGEFAVRILRHEKVNFQFTADGSTPASHFSVFRSPQDEISWQLHHDTGAESPENNDNSSVADDFTNGGMKLRFATNFNVNGLPSATLAVWDADDDRSLPPALIRDRQILHQPFLMLCRRSLERIALEESTRKELGDLALEREQFRQHSGRREQITDFSRAIVKKTPLGLFSIDVDGYLTSANPAFLAITELTDVEDFRTVNIFQLPSVIHSGLDKELKTCLRTNKSYELNDLRFVSRSGEEAVVRFQIIPLDSAENGGLIGIVEDVTAKKKLELNLIQIERLRALGEMAGSVAHDFNNLLGAVLGNVQLLLNMTSDPTFTDKLQTIEQVTIEGAEKVKRLQEFTRIRRDRSFEQVDLESILKQALELIETRAQSMGIIVSLVRDRRRLPAISGNPGELREVFFNILINSLDAMADGGKMTVKTETDRKSVTLIFSDTGEGMSAEVQQRIFEPFFTTKGAQGSGLGLSIVYGIISRHKGEIQITSSTKSGTSMSLNFPAAETTVVSTPPPIVTPSIKEGSSTILVIDDEEVMRNALEDILKIGSHEVTLAPDGETGLSLFRRKEFDLVISDMSMPGISGQEVLRTVKEEKPHLPTILISGWGLELEPDQLAEAGIDRMIRKPFQLKEVLNLVDELLSTSTV